MKRMLSAPLLALIAFYQRFISPAFPRRCRYEPTCSAYAVEAIRELGPLRGSIVAGWRLLRCNPFSAGGIDDVCDRTLFRGHGHATPVADAGEASSMSFLIANPLQPLIDLANTVLVFLHDLGLRLRDGDRAADLHHARADPAALDQADPLDAGPVGPLASDQGGPGEVQGRPPAHAARDDGDVPEEQRQPVRLLPAAAAAATRLPLALLSAPKRRFRERGDRRRASRRGCSSRTSSRRPRAAS